VHLALRDNGIHVDPVNDVVAVVRWMDSTQSLNGFVERVLGAITAAR
jgi:hypothetical protein